MVDIDSGLNCAAITMK